MRDLAIFVRDLCEIGPRFGNTEDPAPTAMALRASRQFVSKEFNSPLSSTSPFPPPNLASVEDYHMPAPSARISTQRSHLTTYAHPKVACPVGDHRGGCFSARCDCDRRRNPTTAASPVRFTTTWYGGNKYEHPIKRETNRCRQEGCELWCNVSCPCGGEEAGGTPATYVGQQQHLLSIYWLRLLQHSCMCSSLFS